MSTHHSMTASERTLIVLEAATTQRRFAAVVKDTNFPKATVHRIISTLTEREFLTVADDGSYLPGPKMLSLAGRALQRIDIADLARPHLDRLAGDLHCTVHLGVINGDEAIYLARQDSDKPYRMPSRVGKSFLLHSSGIGKAILAGTADERVLQFIERAGLPSRTPHTITVPERFLAEMEDVRRRGYALDDEENEPGIRCVAAPVRDLSGQVHYALSASTLSLEHSMAEVEQMAARVIEAAGEVSAALGHREVT